MLKEKDGEYHLLISTLRLEESSFYVSENCFSSYVSYYDLKLGRISLIFYVIYRWNFWNVFYHNNSETVCEEYEEWRNVRKKNEWTDGMKKIDLINMRNYFPHCFSYYYLKLVVFLSYSVSFSIETFKPYSTKIILKLKTAVKNYRPLSKAVKNYNEIQIILNEIIFEYIRREFLATSLTWINVILFKGKTIYHACSVGVISSE